MLAWRDIVYSKTECEFTQTWEQLYKEFSDQVAVVTYLRSTYLEWSEQFAEWAISRHRNYGLRATVRSEGAHAILENHHRYRLAHLIQLHAAIRAAWNDVKREYDERLHYEKTERIVTIKDNPFFRNVHFELSH